MNAILAIIADSGQAIIVIDREGVEINYFLIQFIDSTETLQQQPRPTPSTWLLGVGYICPSKPCHWRGNQIHHGGDVCVLVFSWPKAFRAEFFTLLPERT